MQPLDPAAALALVTAGKLPPDGVIVRGSNASLITTNTAVDVLPAAGSGKTYYLCQAHFVNRTPAEACIIQLQDDEGSPNKVFEAALHAAVANGGDLHITFNPPIQMPTTDAKVQGIATAALGDTQIHLTAVKGSPI